MKKKFIIFLVFLFPIFIFTTCKPDFSEFVFSPFSNGLWSYDSDDFVNEENEEEDSEENYSIVLLDNWIITEQLYTQYICCKAGVAKWEDNTVLLGNYGDNTMYFYDSDFNEEGTVSVDTNITEAMGLFDDGDTAYVSGINGSDGVVNIHEPGFGFLETHTVRNGEAAWNMTIKDGLFYVLFGVSQDVVEFDSGWTGTGNSWTLALPETHTEITSIYWIEEDNQWICGYRDGHDSGGGLVLYDENFNYISSNYLEHYDNQGMWCNGSDTLEFYSNWNDTVFRVVKQQE